MFSYQTVRVPVTFPKNNPHLRSVRTETTFGQPSLAVMCNDSGNHDAYAEYEEALRKARIAIVHPLGPPNLEPRDDIWPTEIAPIFRLHGEGVELAQLAWGFEPTSPKGRAVINFKSEGRSFANSKRCLVPASHFFEFEGTKSPKAKFKFTLAGEPWFCFAGLWSPAKSELARPSRC